MQGLGAEARRLRRLIGGVTPGGAAGIQPRETFGPTKQNRKSLSCCGRQSTVIVIFFECSGGLNDKC